MKLNFKTLYVFFVGMLLIIPIHHGHAIYQFLTFLATLPILIEAIKRA
jgi:hypothetical protein